MASLEPHHLAAGQTLSLHGRHGWILRVRVGRIWLTCSGDPQDYFLGAGDAMCLGAGRVVVEADAHAAAQFDIQPLGARSADLSPAGDAVPIAP